ncbi:MAG: radical SAM/SPASM domain-containing protein [Burkholderiales bacterium]
MLRSVIRQMFHRRPTREALVDEWGRRAPFEFEALRSGLVQKSESMRASGYLTHPAIVHLETIAVCNAACEFCPYPGLERKGTRMPDSLIEKVIGDLASAPRRLPFQLAPYKVSEPFVEERLFDILRSVNERLPHARIMLISNGAALTEAKLARLKAVRNVSFLSISLNYDDAHEYETVMGIPFERTLKRVDTLYEAFAAGELGFPVRIVRVSKDRDSDLHFIAWVRKRYPKFAVGVNPRNDWLGEIPGGGAYPDVPDAPCHRWFDLSVTATGKVAMCCMDGEAKYPKGDVNTEHALEIYNRPHLLELRRSLISRRAAMAPCNGCTYLGG